MGTKVTTRKRGARHMLLRIAVAAMAIAGIFIMSGCSTQRQLSYDQMRQEYDQAMDGYNYADDYDDYYYDYMGY